MGDQDQSDHSKAPRALLARVPDTVLRSYGISDANYSGLYQEQLEATEEAVTQTTLGKLVHEFANALFDSVSAKRKNTRLIIDTDIVPSGGPHQDIFAPRMVRFTMVLPSRCDEISAGTELVPRFSDDPLSSMVTGSQSLLPWTLGAWDTHLWHARPSETGPERLLFVGTVEFDGTKAIWPRPDLFREGKPKPKPFEFYGQTIPIGTTETPNRLLEKPLSNRHLL